jgi:hypothetical protein
MKEKVVQAIIKGLVAAVIFGGGFIASEVTQVKPQDEKDAGGMQAPEPTEMHKWLAEGAGKFKATGKAMMGPGQEMPITGVQTNTMQQGGLWQLIEFKDDAGQFVGNGISGYDTVKKQFVSVWVDNMGAEFSPATGTLSEDKKTLTMRFRFTNPETGKPIDVTETIQRKDKDNVRFEMTHTHPDGKSMKVLEIDYKRM